jgi:hypothetical protein
LIDIPHGRFPDDRSSLAIIEKITPQNFGDAQHHMPVGHYLYHLLTQPFTELHYTLLMAGLPWCDELYFEIKIQVLW